MNQNKSVFTDRDLQDAINEGIFDRQNNVTANPTQIIRFFEKKMQSINERHCPEKPKIQQSKNTIPTVQQFCESKRYELPETDVRVDGVVESYKSVEQVMQEYGELCAKYGAKSIRYQAIELILEKGIKADNYQFAEDLIKKIQNLEP